MITGKMATGKYLSQVCCQIHMTSARKLLYGLQHYISYAKLQFFFLGDISVNFEKTKDKY